MCDFPSWIKTEDNEIIYLTDEDIRDMEGEDSIGHHAIRKVYPGLGGEDCEGFPCPPEIVKAINRGDMDKMMHIGGYAEIYLDTKGRLHRDDGPAIVWSSGTKQWYQHGERHRDEGPAVIWASGTKVWYQHDRIHRDDGPAMINKEGMKHWYQHGKRHRDDGPAIVYDGTKQWYQHGECHRDEGPAIIWSNGTKHWYRHGERIRNK